MATITVTGMVTSGFPAPALDIKIYADSRLLKSKRWEAVAKGESVSDSVELIDVGAWDVFAIAKLSNPFGIVEAESPHKTVEIKPPEVVTDLEEGLRIHSVLEAKDGTAMWLAQVAITRGQYSLIGFAWFVDNQFFGFVPAPRADSMVRTICTGTNPEVGCVSEQSLDLHSFPTYFMETDFQIGPISISLPVGAQVVEIRAFKLQGWGRATSAGDAYNIFRFDNPPGSAAIGYEEKVLGIWGARRGRNRSEMLKPNTLTCFYGAVEKPSGAEFRANIDCFNRTYKESQPADVARPCCYGPAGLAGIFIVGGEYLFRCNSDSLNRVWGGWSDWAIAFSRSQEEAFASLMKDSKEVHKVVL